MDLNQTQKFKFGASREDYIRGIVSEVYSALEEKGYNPILQIAQYLLTEEPIYITNYKGARSLIRKVDRDMLLAKMLMQYIDSIIK